MSNNDGRFPLTYLVQIIMLVRQYGNTAVHFFLLVKKCFNRNTMVKKVTIRWSREHIQVTLSKQVTIFVWSSLLYSLFSLVWNFHRTGSWLVKKKPLTESYFFWTNHKTIILSGDTLTAYFQLHNPVCVFCPCKVCLDLEKIHNGGKLTIECCFDCDIFYGNKPFFVTSSKKWHSQIKI